MHRTSIVSLVVRGYRRGVALALVAMLLSAAALPAVSSAQVVVTGPDPDLARPTDGVGDSPLVP
jgi:hypothetical protein